MLDLLRLYRVASAGWGGGQVSLVTVAQAVGRNGGGGGGP